MAKIWRYRDLIRGGHRHHYVYAGFGRHCEVCSAHCLRQRVEILDAVRNYPRTATITNPDAPVQTLATAAESTERKHTIYE